MQKYSRVSLNNNNNNNNNDDIFNENNPMTQWESLQYTTSTARVNRQEYTRTNEQTKGKGVNSTDNWIMRWLVLFAIGTFSGINSFIINSTIYVIQNFRSTVLHQLLEGIDDTVHLNTMIIIFIQYVSISLFCVAIAALVVVYTLSVEGGSGVAEVIGFLNGINIPKAFSVSSLLVKFISVIFTVGSGMPCGSQGPLVNMGAGFAAGISQGRSHILHFDSQLFASFRNPGNQRDFVSAGAASGVASAFNAPIGGLLFGLEEVSSWWSRRLTFKVLLTCILSTSIHLLFNSCFKNFNSHKNQYHFGQLDMLHEMLFPIADNVPVVNIMIIIPTILIGVFGGIFGALFTRLNVYINTKRKLYLSNHNIIRVIEPVIICLLFLSFCFFLPMIMSECKVIPDTTTKMHLEKFYCRKGYYNPMASLSLINNIDVITGLYDRSNEYYIYPFMSLLIFFIIYFIFATIVSGTSISGGTFIPMLFIGAIIGRMFGIFVIYFCEILNISHNAIWISPGVMALIGSAAFTAGVTRLTVSLTVIILEACWDFTLIMPIIIAIIVSKWCADLCERPLYAQLLMDVIHMPFLGQDHPKTPFGSSQLYCFIAADIMGCPVVVLKERPCIRTLVNVITKTKHNGFPVVTPVYHKRAQSKTPINVFKGTISRSIIISLLSQPQLFREIGKSHFADPISSAKLGKLSAKVSAYLDSKGHYICNLTDSELDMELDLEPYVDSSSFFVNESCSVRHCYELFRSMALRHLTVVNYHNEPVGMITRKDLIADILTRRIYERFGDNPIYRIQELQKFNIEMSDSLSNQPSPISSPMINNKKNQNNNQNDSKKERKINNYHHKSHKSLVLSQSPLLEPDFSSILLENEVSTSSTTSNNKNNDNNFKYLNNLTTTNMNMNINDKPSKYMPRLYSLHRYPNRQYDSNDDNTPTHGSIPSPRITPARRMNSSSSSSRVNVIQRK